MDYTALSKTISYALRHAPREFGLEPDGEGWVGVDELLCALRERKEWHNVQQTDIQAVIAASDKQRFELAGGRMRALYGHSLRKKIRRQPQQPPALLYHGTARRFIPAIRAGGLLPRGRQFVHLSVDMETAHQVGSRRDSRPVILTVMAQAAWEEGAAFYRGNDKIWLADFIASRYIDFGPPGQDQDAV